MVLRLLLCLILAVFGAGCANPEKKAQEEEEAAQPKITDQNEDAAFQSFIGRLREAVAKRDVPMVASMMTENFGYRLEPNGEGAGVFQYWDENNLWTELELVLRERFGPNGMYMVAPANFATDSGYTGYRAGLTRVNGSWRFAYFVSG